MRTLMFALVLLVLPLASAQDQGTGMTITAATDVPVVPYDASGSFNFTVEVGCLELALTGGDASVVIDAEGPSWASFSSQPLTVSGPECVAGASPSQTLTGSVTISPTEDAIGMMDSPINLTATLSRAGGEDVTATDSGMFQVSYRPGHTFTPDVAFPLGVTDGKAMFNVTVNITANARTMFMYGSTVDGEGALSGLAFKTVEAGTEFVLPFTFTAPSGQWNETSFSFDIWSHYLPQNGAGGPEMLRTTETFTFVNLDETASGTDGGKESPGLGAALVLVALVAFALARRR